MSYDRECRQLLLDICREHGLSIDEEPIYGGKEYLEKQEYISDKLSSEIESRQKKLNDIDALVKEVSDIAYEKACEALIEPIIEESHKENNKVIEEYKKWLMSDERKAPKETRTYAADRLSKIQDKLTSARNAVISAIRKAFKLPDRKKVYTVEIAKAIKPSIMERLRLAKEKADKENSARSAINIERKRNNREFER